MNIHSIRFRLTAWYAGLLAGTLLLFGFSVYIGLEHYLIGNATRTLADQSRSIGNELLAMLPSKKRPNWLAEEIEEAYTPEANGNFIRVSKADGTVLYISGQPKDNSFDPSRVPLTAMPLGKESSGRIKLPNQQLLLVDALAFTNSDGRYLVESGMPYRDIEKVLNGLLKMLAIYLPFVVSVAGLGGYWLMRRSLRPVDDITTRAEGITSTNLTERLPVIKTGDELERLCTALNRMISRLEDAFQHIHRFSADASHELRTPLTILQLELEEIVQNRDLPPTLADQIGSALEETQRLSNIVESLMALSRLDAGEVKMEKVPLDLGELVATTTEQMRLLAEEKSIALRCSIEPSVRVLGDQARLKQVVVNLIDNAIKYTPEAGEVGVVVRSGEGKAHLEVFDNGLGMSPEVIPHVFERFYRADKARSRDSGGAGLGLAIIKAICAAHGAEVKVHSQEGKGSRFCVELPLAQRYEYPPPGDIHTWAGVSSQGN